MKTRLRLYSLKALVAFIALLCLSRPEIKAQQSVSIGTEQIKNNAVLWLNSPNKNQGLIIPIVTNRTAVTGEAGMIVFDDSDDKVYYHNGSVWIEVGGAGSTSAGGDLTGSYPNPTVIRLQGRPIANTAPVTGQVLKWNGTQWSPQSDDTGSLPSLTANQIISSNGTSNTAVTVGGDATLNGTSGALTISNNAVNSAKIADGAIVNIDIGAAAAIAVNKLASGTNGQVLTTTGGVPTWTTQSPTFSTNNIIPKGNGTGLVASSIFDNGNVGIGTTTPAHLLEVNKSLASATDTQIRTLNPDATVNTKSGIRFQTGSGWAVQLQTSDGNDWLQLTNNAGTAYHRWTSDSYYPGIGGGYIQGLSSTNIAIMGGSVGIGTATPSLTSKLHVNGNIRLEGSYITFFDDKFIFHGPSYTVVNDHWIPNNSNAHDLGTTSFRWRVAYLNNNPNVSSDIRLKKNVTALSYGLKEVLSLHPVTYILKDDSEQKTKLGFIAQDVQKIIPEIVTEDPAGEKYLGMSYSELIPVLIKAMQEQQQEVDDLKKQVEELRKYIGLTKN